MYTTPIRAAIIGTGYIGTDILVKLARSRHIDCVLFAGRRLASEGIRVAKSLGVKVTTNGFDGLCEHSSCFDLVFDATSAQSHEKHAPVLKKMNKIVIDLTPAKVGKLCVPSLNINELMAEPNINMVTCGGQAATPIAHALGQVHHNIEYIEVVSSIAAKSAGQATRLNIDEYIDTTEKAIRFFSGCQQSKAILNINPAEPSVTMKTTVFAKIDDPDMPSIRRAVASVVADMKIHVPGYELVVEPRYDGTRVMMMARIVGAGDYLPKYAGNMDIITSAAVTAAEAIAQYRCSTLREAVA